MYELVAAAVFFVATHLLLSGTVVRPMLVAQVGEKGFLGLYSIIALGGLLWLSRAYAGAPLVDLWGQRAVLKPVALVLTAAAFVFAVIGLTTRNPTAVAADRLLHAANTVRGMLRITRHPFLWGVALWSIAHLLVNGDAASLVLFGAMLVLAMAGTLSIDAKRRAAHGEAWLRFASVTSNVPFVAILQGRNELKLGEIGLARAIAAVIVWAAVLHFHARWFGVSPLSG
jgi:uncharacterized membrane protein